ncbi:DUF177 domain-containing protein [bacterium]|nr:MAG: DUF177 domain-containing protein [bacterium]
MNINVLSLKDGENSYSFSETPDVFELSDFSFISDVKADVRLYKSSTQISLDIKVDTLLELSCDWCLEPYQFRLNTDFSLYYKYTNNREELQSAENDFDDFKFISPDTAYIDLNKEIRDYIVLSLPMKRVPGECEGRCISCGKQLSELFSGHTESDVNPVWEKLITKRISRNKKNK